MYFDHLNGPAPICWVVHQSLSLTWSRGIAPSECFGRIHVSAKPSSRVALGVEVVTVKFTSSTTLMPVTSLAPSWNSFAPAIGARKPALVQPPVAGSRHSSIENLTSSAVSGVPSCQTTPSRILIVQVSLSSLTDHVSASSPTSSPYCWSLTVYVNRRVWILFHQW